MLPPQHHLVTGPHFAPSFPAVATHCGGSGGNPNSTSLPKVMGDCFQLYCQTVLYLILPSARMNSFSDFCVNINLLFRSFYLHFMDPSRGPRCQSRNHLKLCANYFHVYVHFYGKKFLELFHHILKELYDLQHMQENTRLFLLIHKAPFSISSTHKNLKSKQDRLHFSKVSPFSQFVSSL